MILLYNNVIPNAMYLNFKDIKIQERKNEKFIIYGDF